MKKEIDKLEKELTNVYIALFNNTFFLKTNSSEEEIKCIEDDIEAYLGYFKEGTKIPNI